MHDSLGGAAARALSAALARPVALARPRLLKAASRAVVARYDAVGEALPWPSVVVKFIRDDPATGFGEWAALALLGDLPGAAGVAPAFLAGASAQRVFVMEDLGPGLALDAALARDPAAALVALARTMARLHAATPGAEPRFDALRRALPAAPGPHRSAEAAAWLAARERALAWTAALGLAPPAGLDACLEQVAARFADPGPWLALTHGDPAPSNAHFAGPAARLLDFEYGAFRHALYDLAAWNTLCPLPQPAVALMRRVFREALAEALPTAGDDELFDEAWAALCAYRALAMLTWVSPAVLAADRPFVAPWTARQAVLAAAARLAAAAAPVRALAPVAALAAGLERALAARWPELGPPAALTPFPLLL